MKFEWNTAEGAANERQHDVSFMEAATCFLDLLEAELFDPDRGEDEEREIQTPSFRDRLLAVGFRLRGVSVRILSARQATP